MKTIPSSSTPAFVVVDRVAHKLLRMNLQRRDMRWVSEALTVSLAASELPAICTELPCVFTRAGDRWALVAVTGLEAGRNLMVGADGLWQGQYLPMVLSTWPFRLLEEEDEEGDRLIAMHQDSLSLGEGEPMFDAEGKEQPWFWKTIQDLVVLDAATAGTSRLVAELDAAGLLQSRSLQFMLPNGRQLELSGFFTIEESRLDGLDPALAGQMHRSGALAMASGSTVSSLLANGSSADVMGSSGDVRLESGMDLNVASLLAGERAVGGQEDVLNQLHGDGRPADGDATLGHVAAKRAG